MQGIESLQNEKAIELFGKVLEECTKSTLVVTLKQALKRPDGKFNMLDVNKVTCEVTIDVCPDDTGLVYVYIKAPTQRGILKRVENLWNTKVKRGKLKIMAKPETLKGATPQEREYERLNDYFLTLDSTKLKLNEEKMYVLSFINPIFLSFDSSIQDEMMMVFQASDMRFGIENISEDAIRYNIMVDEENNQEPKRNNYDDYDDPYTNTDDYTHL